MTHPISPCADVRTNTPLVGAVCRQQRQHILVWYGVGVCCSTDYSRDEKRAPRPGTVRALPTASLEEPND